MNDAQEGDEAKLVYVSDVNKAQDYLAEHGVTTRSEMCPRKTGL